jgi:very-short-patch-repair endonuclease
MSKRYRPPEALRNLIKDRARELRSHMTPAEVQLWLRLKGEQLSGLRFRRQYRIGTYIVDFCCPSRQLVVEVDGDSHSEREDYDDKRTEFLIEQRFRVVRFTNSEIAGSIDGVLAAILEACEQSANPSPQPSPRPGEREQEKTDEPE